MFNGLNLLDMFFLRGEVLLRGLVYTASKFATRALFIVSVMFILGTESLFLYKAYTYERNYNTHTTTSDYLIRLEYRTLLADVCKKRDYVKEFVRRSSEYYAKELVHIGKMITYDTVASRWRGRNLTSYPAYRANQVYYLMWNYQVRLPYEIDARFRKCGENV